MTPRDSVAATLDALDASEPFALFLRHSEREPIPATAPYADVELTPLGVSNADALGRQTAAHLRWTASSPFRRCRHTAALLHESRPEDDVRLGAPGPWVTEQETGAKIFARLGMRGVVRAQIEGRSLDAIRSLPEGSELLLSTALERISAGRGSGACVSHDAVLMPALHFLTGDPLTDWLDPLDGFAVQRTAHGWTCIWRGRSYAARA